MEGKKECFLSTYHPSLVMTPAKIFFHIQVLVICTLLQPPTQKNCWNWEQQFGGRLLLIANHLDQSSWSTNQKHWATVRSYLLHSFLEVHRACCCAFLAKPRLATWVIVQSQNHFCSSAEPGRMYVRFSSSNFTVWGHILSTAGDALTLKTYYYY